MEFMKFIIGGVRALFNVKLILTDLLARER